MATKNLEVSLTDAESKQLVGDFAVAHARMSDDYRQGYAAFIAAGFDSAVGDTAVKGKDRAPAELLAKTGKRILETTAVRFKRAQADKKNATMMSLALMAFSLIAAVMAGWRFSRTVTTPISVAVGAARRITEGDLTSTIPVTGTDETGHLLQALNEMRESLRSIVGRVRTGTDIIATASSEIAAGNLDLSSRTEQQASSLEETSSSMEELTATVKENADNARQADNLAKMASEVASKGGAVVAQVVGTMTAINDSSRKIADIISVIDGIAFQTNILALNAAVEAARAGDQGRGFAVVAAEVRTLAQRSAGAAKEIKALIGDSVEKVESGAKLVDDAGMTMGEIVISIKRVTDIMGAITSASHEQTAGIVQINQAITEMDAVTQQNAALVEEAAAAAESLRDQAAALAQVVAVFKTDATAEVFSKSASAAASVATTLPRRAPVRPAALSDAPQEASGMHRRPALSIASGS